jgi:hypothetical protein
VRVRSRPLAEIDEAKLATALVLMGRRLVEQLAAEAAEQEAATDSTTSQEDVA